MKFKFKRKLYKQLAWLYNLRYNSPITGIIDWLDWKIFSDFNTSSYRCGSFKSDWHFYIYPEVCSVITKLLHFPFKYTFSFAESFTDNSGKLLDDGLTFSYIRDRQENVKYYRLKHFFGRVKVFEEQMINTKTGKGDSSFLLFVSAVVSNGDVEVDHYKNVSRKIFDRLVITKKQYNNALRELKAMTPNLSWFEEDYAS